MLELWSLEATQQTHILQQIGLHLFQCKNSKHFDDKLDVVVAF